MSGYRDDGCGGGNGPAWHAAVGRENESYREINESVSKSAYSDLIAKHKEALESLDKKHIECEHLRKRLDRAIMYMQDVGVNIERDYPEIAGVGDYASRDSDNEILHED